MARPIKDGVDYFPKDTGFYQDDKVRLLRARFGAKGMYLLDYLLCEIYGKNGYYTEWNENKCFLVSDGAGCGCESGFVKEFITGCLQCSFFDERVFKAFGVLTSSGIQRRYIRMLKWREKVKLISEYWLLSNDDFETISNNTLKKVEFFSISQQGNPEKQQGNPEKQQGNPQNKLNKIKPNQSNNNSSEQDELAAEPPIISLLLNDQSLHPVYQSQIDEWIELFPAVDVLIELKKMKAWCKANPDNRKTKRGINRFIVNWLSKTQDKGGKNSFTVPNEKRVDYSDSNRYEQMKGVAGVEYDES